MEQPVRAQRLTTLGPTLFPDPPAKGVLKGFPSYPVNKRIPFTWESHLSIPTTQGLILAAGAPFVTTFLAHFWLHFNIREISYE